MHSADLKTGQRPVAHSECVWEKLPSVLWPFGLSTVMRGCISVKLDTAHLAHPKM